MSYTELTIDQGTTFEKTLDLVNNDGAAINVTNYVFSGQIRKSYYSKSKAATFTISVSNAANGNVIISLPATTTSSIKPGRYVYDVKMTDTSNNVTRIVEGIITVTPQVSR